MAGACAGQRVSEYLLDECVGSGAFGEVWRAHHHIWTDQIVAVKIPTNERYVRQLQTEGVAIHSVVHPNVVRPIGLDPFARPPYLIMEFVDGESLRSLIDQHADGLPIRAAVEILRGIIQALSAAHACGVIHGDVKPANILVEMHDGIDELSAEMVKVTDFGLLRTDKSFVDEMIQSVSLLTDEAARLAGTLAYMSPEQREGRPIDARSDLFSCGIVLFEMLSGQRPQGGDLPSQLRSEVPVWLDQVFSRCYTHYDRRYASAEEVLEAIDTNTQPAMPPPIPPSAPGPPPPPAPATARWPLGKLLCPACGQPARDDDNFCINCGQQLRQSLRRCQRCGGWPGRDDKYCIFCGAALAGGSQG
jgi:serine/threonine protein kinase